MSYRLKKSMDLEKAISILETANASAREAEAEALRSIKFKIGSYYKEPQQYTDGDPLQREAIKIIRRTAKTITFIYIPHSGMDEEICKVLTRKVHVGNYGEWIQVNKFSPTISAFI